jgi:putative NADH-flavin reductase
MAKQEAGLKRVCIIGASGKLGQYIIQHALERGYEVVGVCRERSVGKLAAFKGKITIIPGFTNDREAARRLPRLQRLQVFND